MLSANMFSFFFLAVAPLLASAQQNQQTPLREQGSEFTVPLTLHDDERTYSSQSGDGRMYLEELQQVMNIGGSVARSPFVSINIPLDSTQPGKLVFGQENPTNQFLPDVEWIDTRKPGVNVPITHVGIRKGGMVTKDAYSTRLALNTPYISLPGEIYDILIQATKPLPWQHVGGYDDVVDCGALERFPDLVLGLEPETEEDKDDEDIEEKEIVITPRQYVMETREGKCILLAHKSYQRSTEEVVLGWAAVRGRDVVLDWVNERTGFGK